jgi:hypothetical protein
MPTRPVITSPEGVLVRFLTDCCCWCIDIVWVLCRFGWDCHGLPVEYEIDKAHNITSRDTVLEMGEFLQG